jgi:hypothetical protein
MKHSMGASGATIEHFVLKFGMTYANTPDCGKETMASFVASRMTAAPFSIFKE